MVVDDKGSTTPQRLDRFVQKTDTQRTPNGQFDVHNGHIFSRANSKQKQEKLWLIRSFVPFCITSKFKTETVHLVNQALLNKTQKKSL